MLRVSFSSVPACVDKIVGTELIPLPPERHQKLWEALIYQLTLLFSCSVRLNAQVNVPVAVWEQATNLVTSQAP